MPGISSESQKTTIPSDRNIIDLSTMNFHSDARIFREVIEEIIYNLNHLQLLLSMASERDNATQAAVGDITGNIVGLKYGLMEFFEELGVERKGKL